MLPKYEINPIVNSDSYSLYNFFVSVNVKQNTNELNTVIALKIKILINLI
jgi:hypothetical protein